MHLTKVPKSGALQEESVYKDNYKLEHNTWSGHKGCITLVLCRYGLICPGRHLRMSLGGNFSILNNQVATSKQDLEASFKNLVIR